MEAACIVSLREHDVTLYEKESQLGGVFIAAAAFDFKEADKHLLEWYRLQIKKSNITVHLNQKMDAAGIEKLSPDAVILATGAAELKLPIPGIDGAKVAAAIDVLLKKEPVAKKVVVIGGGLTGCELAAQLSAEGKAVTVVEMLPKILTGKKAVSYNVNGLTELMQAGNATILTSTRLKGVNDHGVQGAGRIFAVGSRPACFVAATKMGATDLINYKDGSIVEQILVKNKGPVDKVLIAGGESGVVAEAYAICKPGGAIADVAIYYQPISKLSPRSLYCDKDYRTFRISNGRLYIRGEEFPGREGLPSPAQI
jgi:NADPH-dependent 2,4-dienoyl-CoA reductase/sulfur reductase-like enzyme